MTDDPKFNQWWDEHGQFVRSGGGQYEISFAWAAWQAARATAEQSEPVAWMRTYRQFSEHPIEPDPGYLVTSFHQNADYAAKNPAENVPLYAAPQPSHNRDSVIEECAKVCDNAEVSYNVAVRKETAIFLALMIRALKSQQDAAIESKLAEQGTPVLPTHGSFHAGVLVKLLLDDAFEILRPNSPEDCPEEPWMRVALGKKYWAILTATPRSVESQRSGDGS